MRFCKENCVDKIFCIHIILCKKVNACKIQTLFFFTHLVIIELRNTEIFSKPSVLSWSPLSPFLEEFLLVNVFYRFLKFSTRKAPQISSNSIPNKFIDFWRFISNCACKLRWTLEQALFLETYPVHESIGI